MRSLTFEECGMVAGGAIGAPMYTVYLTDSAQDSSGGESNAEPNGSRGGGVASGNRQEPQRPRQEQGDYWNSVGNCFRDNVTGAILWGLTSGAVTGAVAGGTAGAFGAGVGAVPGAVVGGTVGAAGGGASAITGTLGQCLLFPNR